MGCVMRLTLMADQIALAVRDLAVHFEMEQGVVRALEGVSFDLLAGRTLGIVGESGCGKSVTARSILRILDRPGRVVGGSIVLDPGSSGSTDVLALDPNAERMRAIRGGRIGLIFQEPMTALSVHYTVGNQIIEAVRQHSDLSKQSARDRAIELLREVGIPRPELRVDAYPFQLSGGLRQRVGIAMALAGDPDILIADEPTTALDVTTQAQVLDLLRRLQAEKGIALMLITHDMGVIAEMCDDVAVMYLGRIVEYAPVETLFAAPRHPYTRALLRAVPTILAKPRQRLATIGGAVPHPGARPVGCPFHPRCSEVIEGRCTAAVPPPIPPGQAGASCFLEVPG
jgi:oligopeptide/dipeptide ABC transporter ATP-binding protein